MRKLIDNQDLKIKTLTNEFSHQKTELSICIQELKILKSFAERYFRQNSSNSNNGSGREFLNQFNSSSLSIDTEDTVRWSCSLSLAKVTKWGGIISTPDSSLQLSIRRSLIESNCPKDLINELMKKSNEDNWPSGLNTLETRQVNRNHYNNFVCKRIANKQAVVILACDNRHMQNHLISEPGCLFVFAHGVQ
jgi:E3 ubiquitin-protein ligase NRDP1